MTYANTKSEAKQPHRADSPTVEGDEFRDTARAPHLADVIQRAKRRPALLSSPDIQSLHRIIGNRAAHALLSGSRSAPGSCLPGALSSGIEAQSGISMDDVRVHHNSPLPEALNARAFTRGAEIHVAPGEERHLPHEAWHVVQQKQGRVRSEVKLKGLGLNDDDALEREADVMGARAAHGISEGPRGREFKRVDVATTGAQPVQRLKKNNNDVDIEILSESVCDDLLKALAAGADSEGDYVFEGGDKAKIETQFKRLRGKRLKIDPKAIRQGAIGDCWLISTIRAVALHSPDTLVQRLQMEIPENGLPITKVTLNVKTNLESDKVRGPKVIEVDISDLVVKPNRRLKYANLNEPVHKTNLVAPFIEVAVAKYMKEVAKSNDDLYLNLIGNRGDKERKATNVMGMLAPRGSKVHNIALDDIGDEAWLVKELKKLLKNRQVPAVLEIQQTRPKQVVKKEDDFKLPTSSEHAVAIKQIDVEGKRIIINDQAMIDSPDMHLPFKKIKNGGVAEGENRQPLEYKFLMIVTKKMARSIQDFFAVRNQENEENDYEVRQRQGVALRIPYAEYTRAAAIKEPNGANNANIANDANDKNDAKKPNKQIKPNLSKAKSSKSNRNVLEDNAEEVVITAYGIKHIKTDQITLALPPEQRQIQQPLQQQIQQPLQSAMSVSNVNIDESNNNQEMDPVEDTQIVESKQSNVNADNDDILEH